LVILIRDTTETYSNSHSLFGDYLNIFHKQPLPQKPAHLKKPFNASAQYHLIFVDYILKGLPDKVDQVPRIRIYDKISTKQNKLNGLLMSNPFAALKFLRPSAYFTQDASLVTLFCLFIAGLSKVLNFPNGQLLILFTMAVMSCAAAFPFGNQSSARVGVTSVIVNLSITLGGYVGYHHVKLGQIIAVILVGLAFYHPKNTRDSALWITSAMMFVIFLFFPVSLHTSLLYGLSSLVMGCLFALFYGIFKSILLTPQGSEIPATSHHGTRALIGSSSMALGFFCVD
jgi:hypothetical protein